MDEILERLTGAVGLTGHEAAAADVVRELWAPLVDELRVDRVGNVVGLKRGDAPDGARLRVAVMGHLDQIGLMVYAIERGGFLRVSPVGGVDKRILPGQVLTVFPTREPPEGEAACLRGVVGAVPPHLQQPGDEQTITPWDDLFLDLGLPEETVRARVRVGDPVGFPTEYTRLQGRRRAVAGCDDRSAIAAITWALDVARRRRHRHDIYALATVEEEWTSLGAIAATYSLSPHVAVVVDVDQGRHEGAPERDTIEVGKGPSVTFGLNNHPALVEAAREAAERDGIPFQRFFWPSPYGTDGSDVEVVRSGIPVVNLGIPLRYMHSTVEVLDLADLENLGRLIVALADSERLPVIEAVEW